MSAQVGWTNGPTGRGTLNLLYNCLTTIFTYSWTVLHLDVPRRNRSSGSKTRRKVEWMLLTIIFPEYLFGKAFIELRLALADLYEMDCALKENPLLTNSNNMWEVEFTPRMRFLYTILRIKPAIRRKLASTQTGEDQADVERNESGEEENIMVADGTKVDPAR
ncbi:hypothetical protein BO71DRAFT_425889 [Aspergillus ellipticus CBS 707.79]|uniref:Uncharacterized protein n=1 Tax=Aspergillus ellipticus CBS 707.79 TaxID=1448320 RepID=A0A319DM89_9EURO|nr:hypothetical protein BO71DRAFT_425889 [Aspergillus ellipticus CBS 707.79]